MAIDQDETPYIYLRITIEHKSAFAVAMLKFGAFQRPAFKAATC